MGFNSQSDFNRFMDGYMDGLVKKKTKERRPLFSRRPKPKTERFDRAIELEEKELKEVVEPVEEKKKKTLLQKLMLFSGDLSRQEKEAKKALEKGIDDEDDFDEEFKPRTGKQQVQIPVQTRQPSPRPIGPVSNGVQLSVLRQPAAQQDKPATREVEQNFPYSPNAEKDAKYLIGLVNTILNRMEPAKRNEFYRSSEYRIFESVRKKY